MLGIEDVIVAPVVNAAKKIIYSPLMYRLIREHFRRKRKHVVRRVAMQGREVGREKGRMVRMMVRGKATVLKKHQKKQNNNNKKSACAVPISEIHATCKNGERGRVLFCRRCPTDKAPLPLPLLLSLPSNFPPKIPLPSSLTFFHSLSFLLTANSIVSWRSPLRS